MADFLVPIAPFLVAGASTFPAFHIFREFANVVLKPIVPYPSKTIAQLAQSTPSTPSAIPDDDGVWFPTNFFSTVPAPAFTPEPTSFIPKPMLPPAAAPMKNLDHLPNVLSSNPERAKMVFIIITTTYFFLLFFQRYIQLRRRFSPVTHIISSAITVYLYTLVGPASHDALLSMPVTLHQAKESALPVACATLATFSVFSMLVSVVESMYRNLLAGIELSAIPDNMKPHLRDWVLLSIMAPIAYRIYQLRNDLVPFEVTVRREIESNLASVDPRFVAIVVMAFVALCVVDMLLGFLQLCISLLGLSLSTLTCGPPVLVVRTFQALVYVFFRCGPFRWLTDSIILATAYTFRTWATYLNGEVESVHPHFPVAALHQHETGLADAARLTGDSDLHRIRDLDAKVVAQHTELGTCDSEIALLKRRIEEVERAHSRKQRELTSAVKRLASQDAEIANLRREKTRAMDAARIDKRTIDKLVAERSLWKKRTRPTAVAGAQTLPVVLADNTATTVIPTPVVEKAEIGVQVDQVAPAARILVERSVQVNEVPRHLVDASTQSVQHNPDLVDSTTQFVQHNPDLVDSATQTTETLRVLVDFSAQVQEPPRQVTEMAVQAVEPPRVFADSTTQTDVSPSTVLAADYEKVLIEVDELRIRLHDIESKREEVDVVQAVEPPRVFANSTTQSDVSPPTVLAADYEKVLMEVDELRIRLHDVESKREEVDVVQAEEKVHSEQEAHEQDDASVQLPNGGPKVSIQALAVFFGARLNQAFAPQVVDSMPEDEEVETEENLRDPLTDGSSLALVTDTTAPIPNVSPDMYSTYEAIAGKKFTIPADPDDGELDKMPLRQWIMAALQRLYVARLSKYSKVTKSQTPEQVQGSNIVATQALGQGNHALMIAMWQLAQAHTLSKMSPEEVVNGAPVPAYVTVDWRWKKPMDDDRIGRSYYKLQRHVLDAIRDMATPNPFVVSALNLMEFSIAYAERLYSDIKEPDWFKNSSNPHIRKARLWVKQEAGVWVMDEDLLALAEFIQNNWKWKSSFRAHLEFDDERDPGYALLQIKRGMELETSVAEEAGEQPAGGGEKKPKKKSDGFWGHEMAHYGDQVKEEYDETSVDESIDEEEAAEVEAKIEVTPDPQPATVPFQSEVMVPPVETRTVQPLEEPEPEPVPTYEEKGKGKGPALVKQNSLTEAEKELGPANFERTPNLSWDDELARQSTTYTQPSSATPHPQQVRVYHDYPSRSFHGHGNNRGIPLQIETERNPNLPPRPISSNVPPTTDTQTSFASGLMASRHAPKLTGSMASMHAPRPTGLYASMHAPTPQPMGTMASMHAPKPTGSMASMHAPKPSTSPVIDRNRSMHADDPSPPVSPSPNRHSRNRDRGRRGGGSGFRLGSHQIN